MTDLQKMTQKDFDNILHDIVKYMPIDELLGIPEVNDALSVHLYDKINQVYLERNNSLGEVCRICGEKEKPGTIRCDKCFTTYNWYNTSVQQERHKALNELETFNKKD